MATTLVGDHRTLKPGDETIARLQEVFESAQADSDKAGEVDAVCYYDGIVDGVHFALDLLLLDPSATECPLERNRDYREG